MPVQFLAYRDLEGREEYVNVADISCLLAIEDDQGQPCTEILLISAPDAPLLAHGTPANVLQGHRVTFPLPNTGGC